VKKYYKNNENLETNCIFLLYLQNAMKENSFTKSLMLANSFINRFKYGCKYSHSLEENINNNCPKLFEKEMRVPEFYLQSITTIIKNKNVKNY